MKITDRAGNEFVTAKCVQAHSDLSKRFNVPILHNTGQARHNKGKNIYNKYINFKSFTIR